MYYLETITPIHIGNGEKYSSFEFLLENNKIKIYDFDKIISYIVENFDSNSFIDKLKANRIKYLKDISNHYNINFSSFLKEEIEFSGNTKFFPREIFKFISQNSLPYIPGSEIKGAIRTAIIAHFISKYYKNDFIENFKKQFSIKINEILKQKREINKLKENNKKYKNEIEKKEKIFKKNRRNIFNQINKFSNNYFKNKLSFINKDSKYDIMKIISVEDSMLLERHKRIIGTVEVSNISKNKLINCELLKKNCVIEFPKQFITISNELIDKYIFMIKKLQREHNSQHLKNCLDFLNEFNTVEKILKLTSEFYKRIADRENFNISELKYNEYLIRIGRFKGFFSNTIWILYLNSESSFFGEFFEVIAHKGYKHNPAKSKKTLYNSREQIGWCKIIKKNKKDNGIKTATESDIKKLLDKFGKKNQ